MYIPKFEKITGTDEIVPKFMHVVMLDNYMVATNTIVLAWQKFSLGNEFKAFVEKNKEVYIPSHEWKKISGKNVKFLGINDMSLEFMDTKKKSLIKVSYSTKETTGFSFPKWQDVLPVDIKSGLTRYEPKQVDSIGIDVGWLYKLSQLWKKASAYRLDFFGKTHPILFTIEDKKREKVHFTEQGSIIMPTKLADKYNFSWI